MNDVTHVRTVRCNGKYRDLLPAQLAREDVAPRGYAQARFARRSLEGGVASFPCLSREREGKAWGLLHAHAQKLPAVTSVSIYTIQESSHATT